MLFLVGNLCLGLSKYCHHLFLLVFLFTGQVGGTSSTEIGLQIVFIYTVIWFVSSLGTAAVPRITAVWFALVNSSGITLVSMGFSTGKVEEDSHGTAL